MSSSSSHEYIKHKMVQDIYQTHTMELMRSKICAYRNTLDNVEEWIEKGEEWVVK